MKFIIFLSIVQVFLIGEVSSSIKEIPSSTEEVVSYTDAALAQFEEKMKTFKTLPSKARTFETTVVYWNSMMEELWTKVVTLGVLSLVVSDEIVLGKAQREVLFLMGKLQGACRDEEALQMMEEFAHSEQAKELTPSQAYELSLLLASGGKEWVSKKMLPYTPLKGKVAPVTKNAITVLNWNVCFFPSSLSLLFGGVLPYRDRMEGVARQILDSGADVVCLQEVFSRESAEKLYRLLEKEYAYFYIHIGPKPFGFNPDEIGLSSGLFVASKIEIEKPCFTPFQNTPSVRGYGFFSMQLPGIGELVTTHLNPGSDPIDSRYREKQMQEILAVIETKKHLYPVFLCGDLNINRGSDEYKERIEQEFDDSYVGRGWTCLELRNYWWKAKQNVAKFKSLGFSYESIDYFLSLKEKNKKYKVATRLIVVNDPMHPEKALSDHQAMFSTIQIGDAP
jgi:endonuclease/exonuclease/phosphatase family metal-dependent hydrolase